MKKLLFTTAAAMVLSIPAMAADSQAQKSAPYPVKQLTEAVMVAPPCTVGLHPDRRNARDNCGEGFSVF